MKRVPLYGILGVDKYALVDDEDLKLVSQYRWSVNHWGYVRARVPGTKRTISMHRLIMQPPDGLEVDHRNPRDMLDNRRSNLRLATRQQNGANQPKRKHNTSGYKGVTKQRDRWIVRIMVNYKQLYVGSFDTKEEAALAYNAAALQHFGEFAHLNTVLSQ